MTSPRSTIGVVLPVYNSSGTLRRALESVSVQLRIPDHVVIVNDGSTDDSMSVAGQWNPPHGCRVTVLSTENAGVSVARNRGLLSLQTDFVALLDADDCWLPTHLAQLATPLEADASLSFAFADALHVSAGGEERSALGAIRPALAAAVRHDLAGSARIVGPEVVAPMFGAIPALMSSVLVRRSALSRSGLFDPQLTYGEDFDWLLRVFELGPSAWVDQVTVHLDRVEDRGNHPRRRNADRGMSLLLSRYQSESPRLPPEVASALSRARDAADWQTGYEAGRLGLGPFRRQMRELIRWRDGRWVPGWPGLWLRAIRRALISVPRQENR